MSRLGSSRLRTPLRHYPHLRAIITEDALSLNAPHIRDILAAGCHFILGVKEDDHKYLFRCVDAAWLQMR